MCLCALVCIQTPSLLRAVLRLATEPASPDEGSTPDGNALASSVYNAWLRVLVCPQTPSLLRAVAVVTVSTHVLAFPYHLCGEAECTGTILADAYVLDPLKNILYFVWRQHAREGLSQQLAWSACDVNAEHCLQFEAGELAGVARAWQARPLSACTTH